MRYLILAAMIAGLLLAPAARADLTPCNDRAAKTAGHGHAVPILDRVGGDTIADALPFATVPFTDTGTTCGAANDYDEVCPYEDSVAPDVVYAFTPAHTVDVMVDMQGSDYDTKIYIYDEDLNLIACNDDYYGDYTSLIEHAELVGRLTYYLVIDGYGSECGEYLLNVYESEGPCELMCPPGAMLEGEPNPHDDYVDLTNGGCCGSDGPVVFQEIPGRDNNTQVFCGVSGWFQYQGSARRETDWFTTTMGPTGTLTVTMSAELPTYLFQLAPTECASVGVAQNVLVGECEEGSLTIEAAPSTEIWLWVGPSTFDPPGGLEHDYYDYVLHLDGLAAAQITTVPDDMTSAVRSLSAVKGIFR